MVRLHDVYGMHDIFGPGFPGLLEAFYVQERLIEWLMPDVYKSFVSYYSLHRCTSIVVRDRAGRSS
jgi:hypothetical protein